VRISEAWLGSEEAMKKIGGRRGGDETIKEESTIYTLDIQRTA
jgi:hypothetical protein